jgi:sirohydrochlorin ferrochelatase
MSDPDGMFGVPAEAVPAFLETGPPDAIAAHIRNLASPGVDRVVVTLAAGNWFRQTELLAEAAALV